MAETSPLEQMLHTVHRGAPIVDASHGVFNDIAGDQHIFYAINHNIKLEHDGRELLDLLIPVGSARYSDARCCQTGTFVELLKRVQGWTCGEFDHGVQVYWLSGIGGKGKSTIARTISESLSGRQTVVKFFCSAEESKNDPQRILPTLAHELSCLSEWSKFRSSVANALAINGFLKDAPSEGQLEHLIIRPLREMSPRRLMTFIGMCTRPTVAVQVSTRPHPRIRDAFNLFPSERMRELDLNSFDPIVMYDSIRTFLVAEFHKFREQKPGGYHNWPDDAEVDALACKSDGLFLYASTAFRHIVSSLDPKSELQKIINAFSNQPSSRIEEIYSHISLYAVSRLSKQELLKLHVVVGSVVALARPLSIRSLAGLLSLDMEVVRNVLERFYAVVPVPTNYTHPIHSCHATWINIITSSHDLPALSINVLDHHTNLSFRCLKHLNRHLRQDCEIGGDSALHYAVYSWVEHLRSVLTEGGSEEIVDGLSAFGNSKAEVWLECRRMECAFPTDRLKLSEDSTLYYRAALLLLPPKHSDPFYFLISLANSTHGLFELTERTADLEDAITHYQQSVDLRPSGHPDRASPLNHLANAVYDRFQQIGNTKDLDQVITYYEEACCLDPSGHTGDSLNGLASAVFARFKHAGEMEDMQRAILYYQGALRLRSHMHPEHFSVLNNLANALRSRFEYTGNIEDLEAAIGYYRQIYDLQPSGHPARFASLNNLANAVHTKFRQTYKMEDLDESIVHHQGALELCPSGHPTRSGPLNGLASAIYTRFEQTCKMEDLERAIIYYQEVLHLRPPGHPERPLTLNNH